MFKFLIDLVKINQSAVLEENNNDIQILHHLDAIVHCDLEL